MSVLFVFTSGLRRKIKNVNSLLYLHHEYEIAENLSQMKSQIDNMLFLNINVLDNEDAF